MTQAYDEEKVTRLRARLQDTPDVDLVDTGQILRYDATTAQKLAEAVEGEIIRRATEANATLLMGNDASAEVVQGFGPYQWVDLDAVLAWAKSKGVPVGEYFDAVTPPPPPAAWAPRTTKLKALAKKLGPKAEAELAQLYTREGRAPRVTFAVQIQLEAPTHVS